MRKQAILLAGLHKTATTSIQRTCLLNQEALQRAGYIVPRSSEQADLAGNHSNAFHAAFRQAPSRWGINGQLQGPHEASAARLRLHVREQLAGKIQRSRRRILFMAESVSAFTAQELLQMRAWFDEQGCELRVICHVRAIEPWLASMVAQRVVAGPRLTIESVVGEFTASGSLVRVRLENLRAAFPEAEFRSHEAACSHPGGPAAHFLEFLGVADAARLPTVRANDGATDAGTRIISALNARFGRYTAEGRLNPACYDPPHAIAALRRIGAGKFTLRSQELAPLAGLLQQELQWLSSFMPGPRPERAPAAAGDSASPLPQHWQEALEVLAEAPAAVRSHMAALAGASAQPH